MPHSSYTVRDNSLALPKRVLQTFSGILNYLNIMKRHILYTLPSSWFLILALTHDYSWLQFQNCICLTLMFPAVQTKTLTSPQSPKLVIHSLPNSRFFLLNPLPLVQPPPISQLRALNLPAALPGFLHAWLCDRPGGYFSVARCSAALITPQGCSSCSQCLWGFLQVTGLRGLSLASPGAALHPL